MAGVAAGHSGVVEASVQCDTAFDENACSAEDTANNQKEVHERQAGKFAQLAR